MTIKFSHWKMLVTAVILSCLGCAPSGYYRDATWVKPASLEWLKSADEVMHCYKQQMEKWGKEPQVVDFTRVTILASKTNAVVGDVTSVTIFANSGSAVKHGLARALLFKRFPEVRPKDHESVLRHYGLCFGYCVNDPQPDESCDH